MKLILSKDFFSLNEIMLDFFSISGTWAEFQIDPRNYFFFCLIVFISEALKIVVSIRLLVKVPHEYNFTLSWHFIREISIFVFLSPLSNLKWGVFFCCQSNIIFCLCCHCPLYLINPHLVRPDKADQLSFCYSILINMFLLTLIQLVILTSMFNVIEKYSRHLDPTTCVVVVFFFQKLSTIFNIILHQSCLRVRATH